MVASSVAGPERSVTHPATTMSVAASPAQHSCTRKPPTYTRGPSGWRRTCSSARRARAMSWLSAGRPQAQPCGSSGDVRRVPAVATRRIAASSVAPMLSIGAPYVLALLGFRSPLTPPTSPDDPLGNDGAGRLARLGHVGRVHGAIGGAGAPLRDG